VKQLSTGVANRVTVRAEYPNQVNNSLVFNFQKD